MFERFLKPVAAALGVVGVVAPGLLLVSCSPPLNVNEVLAGYQAGAAYPAVAIRSPKDGAVFPPEIAPCAFSWSGGAATTDRWLVLIEFAGEPERLQFLTDKPEWTPGAGVWEQFKRRSREKEAKVTVLGVRRGRRPEIVARGQVTVRTSRDPVGAPLFYREVNLPFWEAVKDPSRIRWRFGTIDSLQPPPVVLEHLPVCGNCHSFSKDGAVLGMDVDYANNKGSYVVKAVAKDMPLTPADVINWNVFRKEDQEPTFGLLSQVSPDGQTVVSTLKDKSVFVARPDLAFSQLFFPIKGILVCYDRRSREYRALPGADDPDYVQSNPAWSPDQKYIVFARAKTYRLRSTAARDKVLLTAEDCAEFLEEGKTFAFDLYRVPYNNGRGGPAEPLAGASRNGRSNFFPKYSPDGKWIVFCQAKSFMLLQPDSELYIIPAEGGEARRLAANTSRMNSWHSWSPNSRWLVFSSKENSPYTQLFLTHIDERGESSPPVALANLTAPDRAANIPEFVFTAPGAIAKIREQFLNDYSHLRAGYVMENMGQLDKALEEYQLALELNPKNSHAHQRVGSLLYFGKHQPRESRRHTTEALRLDPADACAHYDLGCMLEDEGLLDQAIAHYTEAARLLTQPLDSRYHPGRMQFALGQALTAKGQAKEAGDALAKAVALMPNHAQAHYLLAMSLAAQGQIEEPLRQYALACSLKTNVDAAPDLHFLLAVNYETAGRIKEALQAAEQALKIAQAQGNEAVADSLRDRIEGYRQRLGP